MSAALLGWSEPAACPGKCSKPIAGGAEPAGRKTPRQKETRRQSRPPRLRQFTPKTTSKTSQRSFRRRADDDFRHSGRKGVRGPRRRSSRAFHLLSAPWQTPWLGGLPILFRTIPHSWACLNTWSTPVSKHLVACPGVHSPRGITGRAVGHRLEDSPAIWWELRPDRESSEADSGGT